MRNLIFKICVLVFTIFVIFAEGCCSKKSKDSIAIRPVRLAYIPYSADLPFFVAKEKGYFKDLGFKIEGVPCRSTSEAMDLVLAGKADGAMGNSFSVLFSIHAKNADTIRLINVSVESSENDSFTGFVLVAPDANIDLPRNLKGKKVGTEMGASQVLWVKLYLKNLGLDPERDVTIEQESPEILLNALHAKQLDAVFVFEPYATVGLVKGLAKKLDPFFRKAIINPFPAGGATLSRDFCRKNPLAAEKIIQALDRAIEFINQKPIEAKESLMKYIPLDKETALRSQIYRWWDSSAILIDPIQKLADIMTDNGELASKINVSTMIR